MPGDELLGRMRNLTSSDGRSTPLQDDAIDRRAAVMVPVIVGPKPEYQVIVDRGAGPVEWLVGPADAKPIHAGVRGTRQDHPAH